MGFLPAMLDKSVFSKKTFAAAVGSEGSPGYAVVRITPNSDRLGLTIGKKTHGGKQHDPAIKGVFNFEKGTFSFGVEANWGTLGEIGGAILPTASTSVKGIYEKLNAGTNLAGGAEMGAGLASQLIYQKSGYLEIKIPMMIVDWDGTGQPILSSLLLSRYCLPSYILNGKKELKEGIQKIKDQISKSEVGEKITEAVEAAEKAAKAAEDWAADNIPIEKSVSNNIGDLDDAYTLRASPSDVTVEIGQFFKNPKMVITSVNFEFSKEMTRFGPLYVEVDITLKSRRILTSVQDIGLKLPNGGKTSRYKTTGTNATGLL